MPPRQARRRRRQDSKAPASSKYAIRKLSTLPRQTGLLHPPMFRVQMSVLRRQPEAQNRPVAINGGVQSPPSASCRISLLSDLWRFITAQGRSAYGGVATTKLARIHLALPVYLRSLYARGHRVQSVSFVGDQKSSMTCGPQKICLSLSSLLFPGGDIVVQSADNRRRSDGWLAGSLCLWALAGTLFWAVPEFQA